MEDYNFKKFEGRNARLEDRITVTKSYSIGFPMKFYNDNNIKSYKFVILFYDEAKKAIGVFFTADETDKNKFTIMHSKDGYGGSVVARSFFRSLNIDTKKYHGRYQWVKKTISGIGEAYVIDLVEYKK